MPYTMLARRGTSGVFYVRKSVPTALRPIVGKTQLIMSLRTTDLATAKARYPGELLKMTRLLATAQITMRRPEAAVERIARNLIGDWRFSDNEDRREGEELGLTDLLERLADKVSLTLEERATKRAAEILLSDEKPEDVRDNPPLSTVFDLYKVERRPTVKSWREFTRSLDAFIDTCGDLPVRSIRKEHIREAKAAMLAAPSKRDGKPVRPATIRKLLATLGAVLSWAEREGYIDTNPARGVTRVASLEATAMVEDEGRQPFSVEHVRAMLASLPESGYVRWMILLGAYSGARLAELAGLRPTDIRPVDGVLCMDLVPHEGRSLKNRGSRRTLPIHPEVLKAGFSAEVLPFPHSAHYMARMLTPAIRKILGTTDPRLSFHSLRHSFKDACRRAMIPEEVHDALTGHRGNSVSRGYGRGVPVSVLRDAVEQIRY